MVRSLFRLLRVSAVTLVLGCSGPRPTHTGGYIESGKGGESAGVDAALDATDGAVDSETSLCAGPDGGAVSAPEAIVTGEPNLDGLALSSEGPVWLENAEQPAVWLATNPATLLFDAHSAPTSPMSAGPVIDFAAAGDWYVLSVSGYLRPSETAAVNVLSGNTLSFAQDAFRVAMDEFRVYATIPFGSDISCFPITPGSCGPTDNTGALAIATGRSDLYAVVPGPNFLGDGSYTIQAKAKGSAEPLATVASGDAKDTGFCIAAAAGSVAWAYLQPHSLPADTIYGILADGARRILANDADGVGFSDALRTRAPGFTHVVALDDQYVYWTTRTGKVKRRRLCGGPIEVLATNQRYPMALTVDDSGIYWISRGSDLSHPVGNIMRIRKLDAPGAAPDAASDAGPEAASDASLDATPD